MRKKKNLLNLDIKRRITLGKYTDKSVTGFFVRKQLDGTIILTPVSNLNDIENQIYQSPKLLKSLQKSNLEIKKSITTQIKVDFWGNDVIDDFFYTGEFLRNLEKIISKNLEETFNEIKNFLICFEKFSHKSIKLKNKKTPKNNDIFVFTTKNNTKIIWTITDNKKVLLMVW